jgi:hypothetical protein
MHECRKRPNALFCMPNRTNCILFILEMLNQGIAALVLFAFCSETISTHGQEAEHTSFDTSNTPCSIFS